MSDAAERFWCTAPRAVAPHPERAETTDSAVNRFLLGLFSRLRKPFGRDLHRAEKFVEHVDAEQGWADELSDAELLAVDIDLNAQGLEVWLVRREKRAGRKGRAPAQGADRCESLHAAAAGDHHLGLAQVDVLAALEVFMTGVREVRDAVGVSVTTVSRGSRGLKYGVGGFRIALDRLAERTAS